MIVSRNCVQLFSALQAQHSSLFVQHYVRHWTRLKVVSAWVVSQVAGLLIPEDGAIRNRSRALRKISTDRGAGVG